MQATTAASVGVKKPPNRHDDAWRDQRKSHRTGLERFLKLAAVRADSCACVQRSRPHHHAIPQETRYDAARNSAPIEVLVIEPNSTSGTEGGITGPTVAEAAETAAANGTS